MAVPLRPINAVIRWSLIGGAIVVALGLSVIAYGYFRTSVTVTRVIEGPVVQAFYATGTLQPEREYPVKANTAGIVRKVSTTRPYVDKGDTVMEDEPLAMVGDPQLEFARDKAQAEVEEKRLRAEAASSPVLKEIDARIAAGGELLSAAKREQDRITRLLQAGGTSQSDFDLALDRVKRVWMDVESAKAQRESMQLQLKRELSVAEAALVAAQRDVDLQTVRSPVDGVVLDRPTSLGTHLAINDHLLQVADVRPSNLVMRAQVDEEDVTKVRLGQTVRMVLYSFAGEPFEGKVKRIYPKADPDRRTFEVDVAPVKPDAKFAAGMTGELAFEVQSKPSALIVPSQAVQDAKLWTVRGGRVHTIPADVGIRGVEKTEVLSGVQVGDAIIITPAAGLHDGQRVKEKYLDANAAAELNRPKAKELFRGGF